MIVVDTSALLAFYNPNDVYHQAVVKVISNTNEELVTNQFVLAELKYLLSTRFGLRQELEVMTDLVSGAYLIDSLTKEELNESITVIHKYQKLNIGLTDASLLVLSEKYSTRKILTLDRRHFRSLRTSKNKALTLLPQD